MVVFVCSKCEEQWYHIYLCFLHVCSKWTQYTGKLIFFVICSVTKAIEVQIPKLHMYSTFEPYISRVFYSLHLAHNTVLFQIIQKQI